MGIGLYLTLVPLPAFQLLDRPLRIAISNARPIAVVLFIFAMLAPAFSTVLRKSRDGIQVFALSMAFPVYYASLSFFYERVNIQSMALYASWSAYVFLVVLGMFEGFVSYRKSVKISFVLAAASLASYIVLSMASGETYYFEGRISYGFKNPNYFSQVPEVVFFLVLCILSMDSRSGRNTWKLVFFYVIASLMFYLVWSARSRNTIVAMSISMILYHALRRGRGNLRVFFSFCTSW